MVREVLMLMLMSGLTQCSGEGGRVGGLGAAVVVGAALVSRGVY